MKSFVHFDQPYLQARAEQGKFIVVDRDYLDTTWSYPASGEGRYAILTKEVDPINFQDTATDAFGRLRVSEPYTLFNSKMTTGKNPEYWDEIVNATSTSTHASADAQVTMTVAASGDYAIRQTKQRFIYQAGKSQYSLLTFVSGQIETNVRKKVGLFYSSYTAPYDTTVDGIYFESNGVTNNYYFCIGKTEGSNAGTQSVAQSAWNVDPMNGNGKSGITLDFSKNQILYIDYEWLGVGKVRMGFVIDGAFYVAHEFKHTNVTQNVYMSSPNLPVRYEIRSESVGGTGKFGQICSAIMSEGGYEPTGAIYTVSRNISGLGTFQDASIPAGDIVPLVSLRGKTGYDSNSISLISFDIIAQGNMSGLYQLLVLRNPSYSTDDGTWQSLSNTGVEYKINSTISSRITGIGTTINAHYFSSPSQATPYQNDIIEDIISLGTGISGNRDRIDLAVLKITGNDNSYLFGSLTFKELR